MQNRNCVPCLLGLEGPISDELKKLRMSDISAENGRVYFSGDEKPLQQQIFHCVSESASSLR